MTETLPPLGFDGTINEPRWAEAVPDFAGADYGTISGWDLSPVAGTDRTVRLSPGSGFTFAVAHGTTAATTMAPLPIVSTPTWFVIGWELSWADVGGTVTLTHRTTASPSTAAIPTLDQAPGNLAFHPLWLVQVTPGEQLITAQIDVRIWPSQTIACTDLASITAPRLGQLALRMGDKRLFRYDGSTWAALIDPAPQWRSSYSSSSIVTNQTVAAGAWFFPQWLGSSAYPLKVGMSAGRRFTFPSTGVYNVRFNIPISDAGFLGETALFENGQFVSSTVKSAWGGPVDVHPSELVLRHQGSMTFPVTSTSSNWMLGYHNTAASAQRLWSGASSLIITKVAEF